MRNIFYWSLQIDSPPFSTLISTWYPLTMGSVNGDPWRAIWERKESYFRKCILLVLSWELASGWLCPLTGLLKDDRLYTTFSPWHYGFLE